MNKDTLIKVVNKDSGVVGYTIPELGIHRNFYAGESKDIRFEELERLTYLPGGETVLKEFLEVTDPEAVRNLFATAPEPEYHYSKDDVKTLMLTGSLDQFLDCLDFAPEVIKEMIKTMAVEMPLNDIEKRNAIKEKLGFDVTRAIEIKNTKYDNQTEEEDAGEEKASSNRRAAPINNGAAAAPSGRRYQPVKTTNEK